MTSLKRHTTLLLFFSFSFHVLSQVETIDLLFVGDVMGHGGQIKAAEIEKDKSYDYTPCFEFVKPIIDAADLAIANLEVTLPGKPPYKGYPRFRSPDDLAVGLRLAGFDMLTTANNHSNDARKQGVLHTIEVLEKYGFYQTGTFKNATDREIFYPLIIYKGNFKLAFLNYTYGTNGLATSPPTVVNLIDEKQIEKDLLEAKKLNPDYIIVLMHWGDEYKLIENKKQRILANKLLDWGADMIVGGHPHVVQPIYQKQHETKQKLVAFSLGNFISSQTKPNTDGGIILKVKLEKNFQTQETNLMGHDYIPIWRQIDKDSTGKKIYRVLPIRDFEKNLHPTLQLSTSDLTKMNSFARRLREHLAKSDGVEVLGSIAKPMVVEE